PVASPRSTSVKVTVVGNDSDWKTVTNSWKPSGRTSPQPRCRLTLACAVADTVNGVRPSGVGATERGVGVGFGGLGGFTPSESTRALHLPFPVEAATAQLLRAAVPRLGEVGDDPPPRVHR